MNSHVYEQGAENEQVGAVINGVLDQRSFDLPSDGEASGAGVRLHEGKQQPGSEKRKRKKEKKKASTKRSTAHSSAVSVQ